MIPNEDGGHNDDDCFNYLFLIQEWLAEKHNECYKSNQKRTDDKNYRFRWFLLYQSCKYLLEPRLLG